jgi:hypothetical protein
MYGVIMKVEYRQSVEVTGHAHISIEDIQNALMESMIDVDIQISRGIASEREKCFVVHGFANAIHQALEGIADEAIASATNDVRELLASSLRKHADRWSVK